ncbi:MAG: hypothetical protein HYR72_11835 [Deltaproteobacteria bacterium]|nr:hypothetical protein [Deltaproteobacteria bacterium]MBI3386725.1 hypothetical protein [Deltaproteobacteria bacterium]
MHRTHSSFSTVVAVTIVVAARLASAGSAAVRIDLSSTNSAAPPPPTGFHLDGGASSIDALLDEFLIALQTKDEHALTRLRVTEEEYRTIIIPGTVKPGEPLREVADAPSVFFWRVLNQKSEDVARVLFEGFGGRALARRELRFTKGSRQFAAYTAHGDVRLLVLNEFGEQRELRTGTIAEVGSQYKFIGFNSNN